MSANNPSSQLHDPDYDVAVRDPEAAARGLALVQQLLDEGEDAADRKDLKVGEEIKKELRDTLSELHPADIAYILEALPLDERLIVWDCVRSGRDGEILVEVNEGVRETLIDAMNRDELVYAVESLTPTKSLTWSKTCRLTSWLKFRKVCRTKKELSCARP